MPLGLWRKPRIVRRYEASEAKGGYAMPGGATDIVIKMDVQTLKKSHTTSDDGDYTLQRVKAFSDDQVFTADQLTQKRADCLWFQGKWFECVSCILSENTVLKHYTSEFVQCLTQEEPPDEEVLLRDDSGSEEIHV